MCYSSLEVIIKILREQKKASSRVQTLDFQRTDFSLGRDLFWVGEILCEAALKGKGTQESWQIFKGNLLQAEHSILTSQENKQTYQETCLVAQGTHDCALVQKTPVHRHESEVRQQKLCLSASVFREKVFVPKDTRF